MLFNSLVFVLFAAVFFAVWPWAKQRDTRRWLVMIGASLLFYGWWDWRFVPLLLGVGMIDYVAALGIIRFPQHKKLFLALSITLNLGVLFTFKYWNFATENLNTLFHSIGIEESLSVAKLILPLGISFYTFESMSYVIDTYRGNFRPVTNVLHYLSFLTMYPHLIAGPIIRPADFLPQLKQAHSPTEEERWQGLWWIAYGFFKKVVIADNIAGFVNTSFAPQAPAILSAPYWWVVVTMFAFQIYCDFSGYSDIARGLAAWMGYRLPVNFNHPYVSKSFREFWTRWHISLSQWFRDYVYIPLGGSKKGFWAGIGIMSLTMVISGLWHGAAWTFVIWGALHAAYLAFERITKWPEALCGIPGGRHLAWLLVIIQVWIAWVFFRAQSFGQAVEIIARMFDFGHLSLAPLRTQMDETMPVLIIAILMEAVIYWGLSQKQWAQKLWTPRVQTAVVVCMLVASVYLRGKGNAFIYFQF